MTLTIPLTSWSEPQRFIDSREYRRDFPKAIIDDYSNLVEGDGVNWIWIDPSVKLSLYKIKVGTSENRSEVRSASLAATAKDVVEDYSVAISEKEAKGTLTALICIYEAQEYSRVRRLIPYVGRHQSLAGVGVEMELRDDNNRAVAKFRNFGRSGTTLHGAIEAVVGDIMNYIGKH